MTSPGSGGVDSATRGGGYDRHWRELSSRFNLYIVLYTDLCIICNFIYLFISSISIAPLQATLYSEALPTTARTLCRSFHAEAHRTIVSEGLAQGPYVVPRAGFEPTTLRPQTNDLTHCTTTPHTSVV